MKQKRHENLFFMNACLEASRVAVIACLLCCAQSVGAQSTARIPLWLGFGGGYSVNLHSTDGKLQCLNDPACPTYDRGTGKSLIFGASLDWRFSGAVGLLARLHVAPATVKMNGENSLARAKNHLGEIVPLVRSHELTTSLTAISLDVAANFRLGRFHLFGGVSPSFLPSASWTSASTILSPDNITYANNRRDTIFLTDAAIPQLSSFQFGAIAGLGYEIPLNPRLILVPEISATIPLTSIVESSSWKQTSLALSAHLRFGSGMIKSEELNRQEVIDTVQKRDNSFFGKKYIVGNFITRKSIEETATQRILKETISRTDTLVIGADPPKGPSIHIEALTDGMPLREIVVTGRFVTQAFPVIQAIFFDANSSSFPARYNNAADPELFSIDALPANALLQHKDILNILGSRLKENPRTSISLRGASDPFSESSDCGLAFQRAESVKSYLTTVWGINEKRVKNRTPKRKCEPEIPTTTQSEEGYADNRRVEIDTDDDEILAPLLRRRYIEIAETKPESVQFRVRDFNNSQIASWNTKVGTENFTRILTTESGTGIPKLTTLPINEETIRFFQEKGIETVESQASVTDKYGNSDTQNSLLPIRYDTTEFSIERLSLMHFDVLQDKLNRSAKSAIKRFVSELDSDATISVAGYTDKLGDSMLNNRLAEARADAVSSFIREIKPSANIISNVGYGSSKLPPGISTDALPESRFLSRTVQIEILRRWR